MALGHISRLLNAAAVSAMALLANGSLTTGDPASVGISSERIARAAALLEKEVSSGAVGAASILVARRGTIVLHAGFGRNVQPDSIYLLASISKPVTASSLMLLVERGQIGLKDPVNTYLPEFTGGDRDKVEVRDLLRHASGLPDMLPENTELRREHAPIGEFVKRVYTTPLLFPPGTAYKYQSMGILLAAAIVEKIAGITLREFERRELFEPLGMRHTSLGPGTLKMGDSIPAWQGPDAKPGDAESWGPNSSYWRNFGAPWGGMQSTTMDLAIFLQTFLNGGAYDGKRVFSPATVKAMITDQNIGLNAPWGLGWALARCTAWNCFGDLVSAHAFGHAGATGTVAWADPETQLLCVILTNRALNEDKGRLLSRISNAVAASIEN